MTKQKKVNPIDIIEEKNNEIDQLAKDILDDTLSEMEKHKKLDEFVNKLGLLPNLLNHIEEKRKGPIFPNG